MSLITNKKFGLNYESLEKYQSGIELFGFEVKSLKNNLGSIDGSYITVRGNEAFIIGMFIPPFQVKNAPENYDSYRNRKLLLKRKEILELQNVEKKKGLTIAPVSVYNSKGKVKLEISVAKGKKKFDKRETIKKKDSMRDIERDLKDR